MGGGRGGSGLLETGYRCCESNDRWFGDSSVATVLRKGVLLLVVLGTCAVEGDRIMVNTLTHIVTRWPLPSLRPPWKCLACICPWP